MPLDLAARLDEIAGLATGEVVGRLRDPKEANEISLVHLLKAAEGGIDKSLLLRGQPTSITETIQSDKLVQLLEASLAYVDVTPEE